MLVTDEELVDLIYAATFGERPWEDFVGRLADTSPGGWALLFAFDNRRGEKTINILEGRSSETKEALEGYYGTINPYSPYCMSKPLGVGIPGDRMLSRERFVRTEFYNDFCLKNDTKATLGIAVDRSETCTILISTVTRDIDEAEQHRLSAQYSRLAPHLDRAARFYRRNAPARMATELGASMFDGIEVGVLLVSTERRLLSISNAAQRILGPKLLHDSAGRVRLPGDGVQAALKSMCHRRYDGPQSLEFLVSDIKLTLVKIGTAGVIGLFDESGVAVIVQSVKGLRSHMTPDMIQLAYGLSPAEARVLQGVLDGLTTDQIARSVGRSPETIRTQLKSIYSKTGSTGRVDLMRLMTGGRSSG